MLRWVSSVAPRLFVPGENHSASASLDLHSSLGAWAEPPPAIQGALGQQGLVPGSLGTDLPLSACHSLPWVEGIWKEGVLSR